VNIFDNPPFSANLTRNSPRLCGNPNVVPSAPTAEAPISIRYFSRLFAIPKNLNPRIISNLEISIRCFCGLLPICEELKSLIISNLKLYISIRYFWRLFAHQPGAAKSRAQCPNSTISGHDALTAPSFSIFSFPFSSSANMAP
jgi:hypothetical protein